MKKLDKGDDIDHPIVVMRDGTDKYIVDGHHRACALMLKNASARVPCTVVDVADVARFL
jgi:ParB-like chromosome segregation protein Spo0J